MTVAFLVIPMNACQTERNSCFLCLCPSLANNKEKCMEYLDGENKQMELTVVADEFIATDSGREMGERILHGYYSR
jgi:hypothetical protein